MPSSFIIRFRPTGPWRLGPATGAREHVDLILHSDALFSAITHSMARLGTLDEWLADTVLAETPAVRFSSLFPYQRDLLFIVPPRGVWPPPASAKVRYKGARFVPLSVVESLLNEKPLDEDRWAVDGESACLVPGGWHDGPFRASLRSNAAVDRLDSGKVDIHATACLEFSRDSGLWTLAVFSGDAARERWEQPLRGALRLLADTGIGGERARGWGRSRDPRWDRTEAFAIPPAPEGVESGWWLLSLYAPAESDSVDWTHGNYATLERTGRVEAPDHWGALKSPTLMISEGSVLMSSAEPRGNAPNVAPEGFPHPVYRAGFAVSVQIPWRVPA